MAEKSIAVPPLHQTTALGSHKEMDFMIRTLAGKQVSWKDDRDKALGALEEDGCPVIENATNLVTVQQTLAAPVCAEGE